LHHLWWTWIIKHAITMIVCELLTISNTTAAASNTTPSPSSLCGFITHNSAAATSQEQQQQQEPKIAAVAASLKQQQHHSIPWSTPCMPTSMIVGKKETPNCFANVVCWVWMAGFQLGEKNEDSGKGFF